MRRVLPIYLRSRVPLLWSAAIAAVLTPCAILYVDPDQVRQEAEWAKHRDELGTLARAFNMMAESQADRRVLRGTVAILAVGGNLFPLVGALLVAMVILDRLFAWKGHRLRMA